MDSAVLLERLAGHRTLRGVPRAELEWLAANGNVQMLQTGEVLNPSTGPVLGLYLVLEGHISIRVDRGSGPRIVMEWKDGDVTGKLPYSRMKGPPGDVIAEQPTTVLIVDASLLPQLARDCPELTAILVHVMLDRARAFKSSELLDEKMASLGRLAAGLAHELNNPASAVARSAKTLVAELGRLDAATKRFCGLNLSDGQCATIGGLRAQGAAARERLGTLELADRRDAIDDWLDEHAVDDVDGAPLAESGFEVEDLDEIEDLVGPDKVGAVLAYISTGRTVRQLAAEIDTAATRIHTLVDAVKGFTYVNRQTTPQRIAIGRGLTDTITVLGPKARAAAVKVDLQVAEALPPIDGYGGELNQVWANLLDNAIDATPGGHVRVEAMACGKSVVVRVRDDGPGIPADVIDRIFDPFFTTKDVGQGTGLGLDIARRIVQRHQGTIDVSTGPAGTEFRVTLPSSSGPAGSGPAA